MNTRQIVSMLAAAGLAQAASAQCPPSAPINVNATKGSHCGNIVVTWNEVSGATSYLVYRGPNSTWASATYLGPTLFGNTQFTDNTALVNTSYYYWVIAKRSFCPLNDTSVHSDSDNGWRDQDPMAPTNVTASDGTVCAGVLVSWSQPTPDYGGTATSHTIYRSTINLYATSSSVGTAGPGGGYHLDTTAQQGITYYYWVRAENQCGTAASASDAGQVSVNPNPDNDLCGLAETIQPGVYAGSTLCATNDGTATCATAGSTSPDTWYAFIPQANGTLHIDTCGVSGSFNTVLSVRTGGCPGVQVACNDNACNNLSSLDVPVSVGAIYRIRVAGRGSTDIGNYILHVGFNSSCYANCDNSSVPPLLNANDFQCFLNKYAAADSYANCDNSTALPTLNANDFQCFLNKYAAGCS